MAKRFTIFVFFIFCFCKSLSQQKENHGKFHFSFSKGVVVGGYVDQGIFLNFTGPALTYKLKKSEVLLGMLPSLRFKEDKSEVKNSFVVPTLGVGITYLHKGIALQVPFYYNSKTASNNGKWNVGIGIGINFN